MGRGTQAKKAETKQSRIQSTINFGSPMKTQPPETTLTPSLPALHHTLPISGVPVQFPFPPYPAQIQMMVKIIQSLNRSENALLESPTGSGKSLALLCGTLAWRQHEIKKAADEEKLQQETIAAANREKWNNYIASHNDIKPNPQQQDPEETYKKDQEQQPTRAPNEDDDFQPAPLIKRRRIQHDKPSSSIALDKSTLTNNHINTNIRTTKIEDTSTTIKEPASASLKSPHKIPKIYVCSRTHKQIEQLIGELKRFTNYRPQMTVLGSRDQLCVHPKVSKSSNKSEDCVALLDTDSCTYGRQTNQLLGHRTMRPSSRSIWDIEDAVKLGKSTKGCPYYASRSLFDNAELIFCPYNFVIDPIIRHIMDIKVKGNIVIFDEAHNIEDTARSVASYEVTEADLKRLQKELTQVIRGQNLEEDHRTIQFIVETLLEWITQPNNSYSIKEYEKHVHIWSGLQIMSKLSDLHITSSTFGGSIYPAFKRIKSHTEKVMKEKEETSVDQVTSEHGGSQGNSKHAQECVTTWALRHLDGLFMVLGYLFQEGVDRSTDYSMALIKKIHKASNFTKDASWVYKLGFWCHNPGIVFEELSSAAHSMILTSGTLSPLDTFASELETDFSATLEANHVIDPSQVWVGTVPVGPSGVTLKGVYSVVESLQYQDDVGQALQDIINIVPFGILCFLPSYSTLDKLIKRWKVTGVYSQLEAVKTIFIEPQGDNKQLFQRQIKDYYDAVKKQSDQQSWGAQTWCTGALFFAVYRGKISEGIDFSNNYCRAVVAIGIPYPNLKDTQISLKRSYNDAKKRNQPTKRIIGGDDWYTIQGFRGNISKHRLTNDLLIQLLIFFFSQQSIKHSVDVSAIKG
ncbi:hypothetical protein BC941DRAFT_428637 [Chlamydoabsidia padenii]|nr:hypothetical protein BC941DRAFT_428637 [Chlamydoabsidia padenii]